MTEPDRYELARRAVLEASILGELADANDNTRRALYEALRAGERVPVTVDGHALGHALVTNPQETWKVQDWSALTRWVEANVPDRMVTKVTTTTEVDPAYVAQLLRNSGEHVTDDGEVLYPDGIGASKGTPRLTVNPTDAAHEVARTLIGRMPELPGGES